MSGSVRKKTRLRQAVARQESIREEPKKAQWSNQEYTTEEILKQFSLPQIVKCNQDSVRIRSDSPLPINFGNPLVFYDKRTIRKLLAKNIGIDAVSNKYIESNETIVIPADYEGLFLRLQSRTCKDNTCFRSIEAMARNTVRAFLNMTKFTAFRIGENVATNDYTKVDYTPGSVFIVDSVCTGTSRSRKDIVQQSYLKCKDEKDVQILIPFHHPGEFSEVLTNNNRMSVNSEYLIENQKFPMVVRFISSKQKPRLKSFSGLFTLVDSFEESTVIGCVLNPSGFTMFELPVSSPLSFHLALNNQDMNQHPVVKNALKLCEAKHKLYAKDMKYKFKFSHRIVQLSGKKYSTVPEDGEDDGPKSALDSARFDVATTYLYI
ncbi:unnamed protein product [Mytilus coruscus]|uniref:CABIT domain-containing protein n=1 Tax=Mytilus coruscus TaxID=42192 RepID=A0A6J8ENJ5_MYTCO|nr:unnamed protein product [Mytilus coruscus]